MNVDVVEDAGALPMDLDRCVRQGIQVAGTRPTVLDNGQTLEVCLF
jgi:hypothetical protein